MALQMVTCHKIRGGAITKRNKHCICIKEHEVTFEVSLSYKKKVPCLNPLKVKGDVIFEFMLLYWWKGLLFGCNIGNISFFLIKKKKNKCLFI